MDITFGRQRIQVLMGPHRSRGEISPRREEIDAMVGVGTDMAYHQALPGTVLYQRFPDAWMVSGIPKGSSVTCSPLPADAETAQALVSHLHTHRRSGRTMTQLIEQCAQSGGRWLSLSEPQI